MSRSLVARMILCVAVASLTPNARSQAVSGNIIGTITDPSGAAVPDAQVKITNLGTNASHQTSSNDSGNYTGANLAPAPTPLRSQSPGFSNLSNKT